jgi:hypothetical protein
MIHFGSTILKNRCKTNFNPYRYVLPPDGGGEGGGAAIAAICLQYSGHLDLGSGEGPPPFRLNYPHTQLTNVTTCTASLGKYATLAWAAGTEDCGASYQSVAVRYTYPKPVHIYVR